MNGTTISALAALAGSVVGSTSLEMVMRGFTKYARSLVRSVVVICVISLAAPCAAQEPDPPTSLNLGHQRGPLFAPSAWVAVSTPVQKRVDLKFYGFYIGELDVPVAQIDVPVRATKFFTVTPSYMYYSVPASGLNKLTPQPGNFTESYDEHQLRIDGTFVFSVRKFEISARGMYVRRFRPTPLDDIDRYRGRIGIARPIAVRGHVWKPFASYEKYYEPSNGGWNRHRIWSGVTLPVNKRMYLQPSFLWEFSEGGRDIHYALLGLIVNTR